MNQVEVKRRQIEMVSYIIGLINILIFGRLLGNNGITYLVIAWEGFSFVWKITAGGLRDVLGKMLRVRKVKGQYKNVSSIRKRVLILQGVIGVVAAIVFLICAGTLAKTVFKVPYSTLIMSILAPAICLRTLCCVLIGFFQGEGTELPAVVAAPLRQILIMGLGLIFVKIFGIYGTKVSNLLGDTAYTAMYSAVGVAVAMVLAEIFVLLFLGFITMGNRRTSAKRDNEEIKQKDTLFGTIRVLYGSMGIFVFIEFFKMLPVYISTIFYRKSVADIGTFAENYGMFAGKYFVFCGILVLLICIVLLSVMAKTTGAFKKEDYKNAKALFQNGLHIGMVHGLFATVVVATMAEQFAGVFCQANDVAFVTNMLRCGSALILLVSLFFYFSEQLQCMVKKYYILGCLGIMNVLFVVILSVLLNGGKTGILAIIYATIVAMSIGCLILGFLCCRLLHMGLDWLRIIVVPAGAVAVTGLVCMLLGKFLTPHLGNLMALVICFVLAVLLYWTILLFMRNFQEQELKNIPGGRIIFMAGQTLHTFE